MSGAQGKTFKSPAMVNSTHSDGEHAVQWTANKKQITPLLETLSLSGALTAAWIYLFIFHCLCNDPSLCMVSL